MPSSASVRRAFAISLLVLNAGALGISSRARAQACCVGANTLSPARLGPRESALLATQLKVGAINGSFDALGGYLAAQKDSAEVDLEQDLIGAAQITRDAQVALLIPIVETWRKAGGLSEGSGGVGDLNLSGRYNFTDAGDSEIWPGVSMLLGLTLPTGTAFDRAKKPLVTDATGIGAVQGTVGVALEQIVAGHWLLSLSGLLTQRMSRRASGVDETLGLNGGLAATAGYLTEGDGLALVFSYNSEANATIDGAIAQGTGRRQTSLGLAGGMTLGRDWRLQAGLTWTPPISSLSVNQPASLMLSFTLIRIFG
jgi:hypothetical protein